MNGFERANAIADAVLYEGYLLFPYTASAPKNKIRWQFGVVTPPAYAARGTGETSSMTAELVARLDDPVASYTARVRFLRLQERVVERFDRGAFTRVVALEAAGQQYVTWDEAVPCEIDVPANVAETRVLAPIALPSAITIEELRDGEELHGRVVRRVWQLTGYVELTHERLDEKYIRVRMRITNTSDLVEGEDRTAALRTSMLSAHALLAVNGARWSSLLDPPEDAVLHAAACTHEGLFPVLAGDDAGSQTSDVAFASPIILYDFPSVAAQSRGNMFDGTEIDELLNLSILALSDAERNEARATDAAAREIVDRAESLGMGEFEALHGLMREEDEPEPGNERVTIDGVDVAKGARVRLHPKRRADVWDEFIDGKTARVAGVYRDMEDNAYVAVIVDDDPASEFHEWYGRSLFFACDEVEPLGAPS